MTETQATSIEKELVSRAASIIARGKRVVALTGAGISTASGIPDFRSPENGLWEKQDPMECASLHAFRRNPGVFYEWLRPLLEKSIDAKPNPAHVALAKMEDMGLLELIITQNIDGLHTAAGSQNVVEIHGHLRSATCLGCFRKANGDQVINSVLESKVPHCDECGGILKPDVILLGEQMPYEPIYEALAAARNCDVMLVAGSSLTVEPAASLPFVASSHNAKLVIINLQTTVLDTLADCVIHEDVARVIPAVYEEISGMR